MSDLKVKSTSENTSHAVGIKNLYHAEDLLREQFPEGYVLIGQTGANLIISSKGTEHNELLCKVQQVADKTIEGHLSNKTNEAQTS